MNRFLVNSLVLSMVFASSCGTPNPRQKQRPTGNNTVLSLQGEPLRPVPIDAKSRSRLLANLAAAQKAFESDPHHLENVIWLGRRMAYLGRFQDAIDVFSEGLRSHPLDPKLLRHRGHRFITVRHFDAAIADLELAAQLLRGSPDELEPDGAPNPRGIPTSTLQFNVWYHLGLGYYLKGDWKNALRAYRECMLVSKNPDSICATTHWLYMTLRRLGSEREAARTLEAIDERMNVIENQSYFKLCLFYQGKKSLEAIQAEIAKPGTSIDYASIAYGVANWHLYNGRRDLAFSMFEDIVKHSNWAAFGAIASEVELFRIQQ